MGDALVEPRQHRASRVGHVGDLVILADERPGGLQVVKPHQGQELDFGAGLAPHQVDLPEAGNPPSLDARNHLAANDSLISVSIVGSGPPAPQAANHWERSVTPASA